MLPTFVIAGAPKSGTTALWTFLGQHPDVCMARVKEARYFTRIVGRDRHGDPTAPWRSGEFDRGQAWYEDLYRHCAAGSQRGEATPTYLFAPDAPRLLRQTVPEVRILFILREPVARLYSHYWAARAAGARVADFAALVRASDPRFRRYAEISAYGKHLARYCQVFPREQLLLLISTRSSATRRCPGCRMPTGSSASAPTTCRPRSAPRTTPRRSPVRRSSSASSTSTSGP